MDEITIAIKSFKNKTSPCIHTRCDQKVLDLYFYILVHIDNVNQH